MLRMFRLRGKRIWFLLFAACATFLIFRWGRETEQAFDYDLPLPAKQEQYEKPVTEKLPHKEIENIVKEIVSRTSSTSEAVVETPVVVVEETSTSSSTAPPAPTIPAVVLPDRQPPSDINGVPDNNEPLHPSNPKGRLEVKPVAATTTIHWEKQVEHFPVPKESIIHLPTGDPVRIPKIQYEFKDEIPSAKISREKRQSRVKAEFQKAWKGYREKAWMHDEVSPVSGNYRDPFCGWAATLVDGLDTLWIMGLEHEFEDAVKGVSQLDFTTSARQDIPMFETTIRYLGGLVAAYDVSGKKYKILLDKAIELADVMMGAFDTPNRMPVLYYHWAPAFASQAKRASAASNTAELGSLCMEFTRLAQLTQEPRYYDAVARITNALSEWQDRGTAIDGVFPESIDASGCNRTEVSTPVATTHIGAAGGSTVNAGKEHQPLEEERNVGKPKSQNTTKTEESHMSEMKIIPGNPARAEIAEKEDNSAKGSTNSLRKRQETGVETIANATTAPTSEMDAGVGVAAENPPIPFTESRVFPSRTTLEWDCRPQGLEPGSAGWSQKFSMGGGQDSTYEYFPKQYLLLGGHEQTYGKMYLKTIEAVRKYMLYRPMIPGDRSILFSGSIEKRSEPQSVSTLTPEVEHLTCFIGGMIGMASKIFEIESDLELAKKLTDGCVWAYESYPSGIMPEGSTVAACKDMDDCHWDEKAYRLILDPMAESRDQTHAEFIENMKNEKFREQEAAKPVDDAARKKAAPQNPAHNVQEPIGTSQNMPPQNKSTAEEHPKAAEDPIGSAKLKKDEPVSLQRRALEEQPATDKQTTAEVLPEKSEPRPNTDLHSNSKDSIGPSESEKASRDVQDGIGGENSLDGISQHEMEYDDYVRVNEVASGREAEVPLPKTSTAKEITRPEPIAPLNHTQYVDGRIEQEGLPPGFTNIRSKKYILRPEAIESVWYMYRITGDTSWQDKGWKMFESIINATSAEYGHSAIWDVTEKNPTQIDEMESFWLAETLKYFYLLYSTPDTISLDDWVLNTEAHPFKRDVK